ncbi:MAG TPA: demethoxyubiquinone hydroxylase family protein [Pyrinomonadaceae bacterium]|nr:demethoxyubiquinone hydroxylase family protein [Pyrinomonadaceae bacterium]
MTIEDDQRRLARVLQGAYSGELAAAYAYRGHWKSLRKQRERERVKRIEDEEWVHREKVRAIMSALSVAPVGSREKVMWTIGRTLGLFCHVAGWFLPMYFAGRLESTNVEEYETAAFHARRLGLAEFASDLEHMAAVEGEHEVFFREMCASHPLLPLMRRVFGWC